MVDLSARAAGPEWMDGDDVPADVYAACIEDLARVNRATLAYRPTLDFVARAMAGEGRRLTLLDIGFGAGDMLREIAELAKRRGWNLRLVGIDINPRSAPVAERLTPADTSIEYLTGDAYDWPADEPLDLVVSSLVTHHMEDADIERLLRWMEARTARGWFVNDLHRSAIAYHGFRAMAAAARWHPFVRHDGPLSVARSFRRADWQARLQAAEVEDVARLRWWVPFRYCVERLK